MHDWNHDGRTDAQDSFIDYRVYTEVTGSKNAPRTRKTASEQSAFPGRALALAVAAVILALLISVLR